MGDPIDSSFGGAAAALDLLLDSNFPSDYLACQMARHGRLGKAKALQGSYLEPL